MNKCDISFFFYIEYTIHIVITCIIKYFCWILMKWYLFTVIVVIRYFFIGTITWLCMIFYLQNI